MRTIPESPSRKQTGRREDAPTAHVARLASLLFVLLRSGSIDYATYNRLYELSPRQFQRDLMHLRLVGDNFGFMLSQKKAGRVIMQQAPGNVGRFAQQSADATATMRRIAAALGEPVANEFARELGDASVDHRAGFLHVRAPRPADGSRVAGTYEFLKAASESCARVEFRYLSARGEQTVRCVEPYLTVLRSGRYYLVGYDVARGKGWRKFALDRMLGPYRRAGSFTRRAVPDRFLDGRAAGWFEGAAEIPVTVELSPAIAASVTSSVWQPDQLVEHCADGSARITLNFADLDEAVRWAFRFAPEALVLAPREAVQAAGEVARRIALAYETAPTAWRADEVG